MSTQPPDPPKWIEHTAGDGTVIRHIAIPAGEQHADHLHMTDLAQGYGEPAVELVHFPAAPPLSWWQRWRLRRQLRRQHRNHVHWAP